MVRKLLRCVNVGLLTVALSAATTLPSMAASNACYVTSTNRGQYIVQTAGDAGTISAYADGQYRTTVSRKQVRWYVTSDLNAVVRGYDSHGLVC